MRINHIISSLREVKKFRPFINYIIFDYETFEAHSDAAVYVYLLIYVYIRVRIRKQTLGNANAARAES